MNCGKLELDILNTFWYLTSQDEDKDISIQDVVDYLAKNGTNRAYTTIKTVMDRLTCKSVLVRYKTGKKFFYKSTIDKHEMRQKAVRSLANELFNGDYLKLLQFVEDECSEFSIK